MFAAIMPGGQTLPAISLLFGAGGVLSLRMLLRAAWGQAVIANLRATKLL